jgi:carboxypeptidase Taq
LDSATKGKYQQYKNLMSRIADIRYANAVLQWDQETYLPVKGAEARGQQIATLSELAHEQFSSPFLGELLNELAADTNITGNERKNILLTLDDYSKNKKYPGSFVRGMSEQINRTFHAWIEARKHKSFSVMQPELDKLLELKKQESDILGYEKHVYDAHLNEHDKGVTVEFADKIFGELQPILTDTLTAIQQKTEPAEALDWSMPKDLQWQLGMDILKLMGFDFTSGRQDVSEHPFTISFHPTDVRITTRINENDFSGMLWSCIHEGGHGIYEQGLLPDEYGLPLGEAASLSIHESQSRLWENNIGRSRAFCKLLLARLKDAFPQRFREVSEEVFYKAANIVKPSLIRTEADEVTYHHHVLIRYELEKNLLEGTLKTADLPFYWNQAYKSQLGLDVPDDNQGCLQDVHWSHGSFGYFPTYTLGSLYAVQFFDTYAKSSPGWEDDIAAGNFHPLKNWLSTHIFPYGRYYNSRELCNKCTGESLNTSRFSAYLNEKFKSNSPIEHE